VPLRIFISYRQSDTSGYARALFDRLTVQFGDENVFLDVATMQPGTKWLEATRSLGSACGAFVALMGPNWASTMRERATSAEDDHVRNEIETALGRGSNVDVIPALVGNAVLPTERQVPPSIRPLLRRQAIELRPERWDADVEHLIEVLRLIPPARPDAESPQPAPPRPAERSPIAPRPDRTHYDEIVRLMLDEGTVVPVLGPGANSGDRDRPWHDVDSGCLPDSEELARYIATSLGLRSEPADLAHVSQHMAVYKGERDLYRLLRRALTQRNEPCSIHRLLAALPATLSPSDSAGRFQLIVTTNYDDALERAFADAEEPYDLAVYMASGTDAGRFVHVPFDGEPAAVPIANAYGGFPINPWGDLERSVIVKIHGAIDGARGPYTWRDNYVITEDDYIDYLTHSPVESVMPQQILAKLRDSHLLFLGYTMRDWNLRVFLHRVFGRRVPNNSWAIQPSPDRLDSRFWMGIGVELLGVPMADYVTELGAHAASLARPPT
jgi:SIR2-like domain/TIR domain